MWACPVWRFIRTTALSNSMKPSHACGATQDGSWWRGLTERGPLEKGMASHFSILALRTPWTVIWNTKHQNHIKFYLLPLLLFTVEHLCLTILNEFYFLDMPCFLFSLTTNHSNHFLSVESFYFLSGLFLWFLRMNYKLQFSSVQ